MARKYFGTDGVRGRVGEAPALELGQHLRALGFTLRRLKTGTPARLDGRTIDHAGLELQPGEDPAPRFVAPDDDPPPLLPQVDCHLTWTTAETHDVVRAHLHASAMYSGAITGLGPRYCPSIEDKVVRFAARPRHQVFLEPEGLDTHSVYPNGVSTSLPAAAQMAFLRTIPGLERVSVLRPGYAVEYDALDARDLDHSLASKDIAGLYFAGQINGTSGYEEAAIQGLLAGANAALALAGREPLVLSRAAAYGGVLVDDLVTRGTKEPYRMMTSRAEFRLLLREDNTAERLLPVARAAGLVDDARWAWFERRTAALAAARARVQAASVTGTAAVEAALAINPNYTEAALNLSVTYNDRGKYDRAREVYSRVVTTSYKAPRSIDPFARGKLANMHADLGAGYASLAMYDEAVREYGNALGLCPEFADLRVRLGAVYRDMGDHDAAIHELTTARDQRPEYLPARVHLGVAYFSAGRKEDAVHEWREVLQRDPTNKSAALYLRMVRE